MLEQKTGEAAYLDEAQSELDLARSVFDRSSATKFLTEGDAQQAEIDQRR